MLVGSDFTLVQEKDFDKAIEGALSEIACNLDKTHPFRRLLNVLNRGTDDEALLEELSKLAGDEAEEMGFSVTTPNLLSEFSDYLNGNLESLWDGLFPGRRSGLWNWMKYHIWLKRIEGKYKHRPNDLHAVWYRDEFENLINMIRRAIEHKYCVIRALY
jgi:hypothetical protein